VNTTRIRLLLGFLVTACGGTLLTVPSSPQPLTAPAISVDYPPPPAKIEEIPVGHHASKGCVWRDGYWDWTGRRWEWQAGHAVIPPAGCYFARPKLEWTAQTLSFFRPAWYAAAGSNVKSCNETLCPAITPTQAPE
jgi:hypothetical protein